MPRNFGLTRRETLGLFAVTLAGCGGMSTLPPTPQCTDPDEPTPPQTEGPFFTPGSPERAQLLEAGLAGVPLALALRVVDRSCQPVSGALVELWHADDAGAYDNVGFTFRGHLYTDATGAARFATIRPGLYPGRTRHFHLKAMRPGGVLLTTQLYFPGEAGNEADGLFDPALLMALDGSDASFDIVLA